MSQPAFMTPRGVVRCALCRTDDYGLPPGDTRISEQHVSARFNDNLGSWVWRVFLEGEDVTRDCYEALAGDDGVVYLFDHDASGHRYVCPTQVPQRMGDQRHAVLVQHRGKVRVVRRPRDRAAAS